MKQSVDVEFKTAADTSGVDKVKHALGSLTTEAEKANAAGKGAGINLGTAMSAAHGNVSGIVKLVIDLGKRVGILKDISLGAIAAVAAAATALFKLFSASKDLVKEAFNLKGVPKDITAASAAMLDLQNAAGAFADDLKAARDDAAQLTKSFNEQVDAVNKLVKAQNELHRQQMLATAETDAQRENINAVYDALNEQGDDKAAEQKLSRREKDLNDEEARLIAEIAEAEKNRDAFLDEAAKLSAAGKGKRSNAFVSLFYSGNNEKAAAYFENAARARSLANDEDAKIEAAQKKLEELKAARQNLVTEIQAAQTAAETHIIAAQNKQSEIYQKAITERDAVEKKAAEEMSKAKADEEKKRIDELNKAAEERAKTEADAERKMLDDITRKKMADLKRLHDRRMDDLRKEQAKWEESQARAIDTGRGGFAAFRAKERDAQREKEREDKIKAKNIAAAQREKERLEKEAARGKGFATPENAKRIADLEDYIAKLGDKSPYEQQMLEATRQLGEKLDTLNSTLGNLGL